MSGVAVAQGKPEPEGSVLRFEPRHSALALFTEHAPEVVLAGPAGTGKTRANLELLHLRAVKYPGSRHLMLRKTFASLKGSAMVTFDEHVRPQLDGVVFHGDTAKRPPHYAYPADEQGRVSVIVVGGLDKPMKVMSSEYDTIYVPEATELIEAEWEALNTRLRAGGMPYQQIHADVNPDSSTHWMKQRAQAGRLLMLESRHEDNPRLWDGQAWTAEGQRYIGLLDALTGVRLLRLRYGVWAAAEGMVYQDSWDRARNVVDRGTICARGSDLNGDCGVPRTWPRYLSVDFGYTHPFVMQWWAEDNDGRFYRYREVYMSHRLVEDHAREALRIMGYELVGGRPRAKSERSDPLPYAVYCDHDAEDRFTLERHMGLLTQPAYKAVSDGIQAVAARLRPAGDDRPRLVLLRDSLVERDVLLAEAKQPTCTEDEIEGYVWNLGGGRSRGEEPVKEHDHGADAMRYLVATRDRVPSGVSYGPKLF